MVKTIKTENKNPEKNSKKALINDINLDKDFEIETEPVEFHLEEGATIEIDIDEIQKELNEFFEIFQDIKIR